MRELLRIFIHRLAALFRRRRLEDDLDEELRSHLDMAVELNLSKGMSLEEGRREALRGFGGVEQTKELYRDQRGTHDRDNLSRLAFRLAAASAKPWLFYLGGPLPDSRDWRQCRCLQLDRRDFISSLSRSRSSGAIARSCGHGSRRN
jgi:hypothetical protein